MNFGVQEGSHIGFSVVFSKESDQENIAKVIAQLRDDEWDVDFNPTSGEMKAIHKVIKLGTPAIVQGPADPEYMAMKAYNTYQQSYLRHGIEVSTWDDVDDLEHAAWVEAIEGIL